MSPKLSTGQAVNIILLVKCLMIHQGAKLFEVELYISCTATELVGMASILWPLVP